MTMRRRRTWAVIDDVFANKYFPGQDPIGKRILLDGDPTGSSRSLASSAM